MLLTTSCILPRAAYIAHSFRRRRRPDSAFLTLESYRPAPPNVPAAPARAIHIAASGDLSPSNRRRTRGLEWRVPVLRLRLLRMISDRSSFGFGVRKASVPTGSSYFGHSHSYTPGPVASWPGRRGRARMNVLPLRPIPHNHIRSRDLEARSVMNAQTHLLGTQLQRVEIVSRVCRNVQHVPDDGTGEVSVELPFVRHVV
ncbi:uncharacterized protein LAESUDRAFT_756010 [Laetiporus sulphureus 93-53]|uniref:Uncharacterized protein n=1 Tax=Laetiporus sulphureus 93-53 TaxID=1314785 RepID=A0A165GLR1_9APHY|nr:uncharacterized protein LAESUDRAFT_756010 [Laetiporus sulphureus 93-53]KZT10525.1 hypothetical protein LAESUDRAFT_756010 [Laetiporus sulphureus 93-53]